MNATDTYELTIYCDSETHEGERDLVTLARINWHDGDGGLHRTWYLRQGAKIVVFRVFANNQWIAYVDTDRAPKLLVNRENIPIPWKCEPRLKFDAQCPQCKGAKFTQKAQLLDSVGSFEYLWGLLVSFKIPTLEEVADTGAHRVSVRELANLSGAKPLDKSKNLL